MASGPDEVYSGRAGNVQHNPCWVPNVLSLGFILVSYACS